MKNLKMTGMVVVIVGLLALMFACKESGSSGTDYSAVSVTPIAVSDVSGSYSGNAVADRAAFENDILAPLLGSNFSSSLSISPILSSAMAQSGTSRAMAPFVDKSGSGNETINLTDLGLPFTAGTLNYSGNYDVYGEKDDAIMKMNMNISADLDSTLTGAEMSLDTDATNTGYEYIYSVSGKANANIKGKIAAEVSGTDPNSSFKLDLDYGVAFSLGMVISVDDRTSTNNDIGAIVIMNLKISKSNHNTYNQSDYGGDYNALMEAVLNGSVPTDATLNVSVYNNGRTLIFAHSYTMKELETLMS